MSNTLRLDPPRTALLIVDMQHAFLMPGGSMARLGLSTTRGNAIIEPIHRLLDAFRARRLPVIHTLTTFRSDYVDAGLVAERFPALRPLGHIINGTWDAQIVERLLPRDGEYMIAKSRFSAFYGTSLELVLRALHVDTLVVAGVATNLGIESTIRDAFARDMRVVLPRDATASYTREMEDASLATLGFMFADVVSVADVESALAARENAAAERVVVGVCCRSRGRWWLMMGLSSIPSGVPTTERAANPDKSSGESVRFGRADDAIFYLRSRTSSRERSLLARRRRRAVHSSSVLCAGWEVAGHNRSPEISGHLSRTRPTWARSPAGHELGSHQQLSSEWNRTGS